MRTIFIPLIVLGIFILQRCAVEIYPTNGETIYRTGKNLQGVALLDKSKSQFTFVKSCQTCHGKSGELVRKCVIKWSSLTNPAKLSVPYTDSLFFKFLDDDLKSNGLKAQTGVHWNMSVQDKKDLIEYLKIL